jgi:hypothetical protein
MIFGMLPMSIGSGSGGELLAPMGRAVIGGVITSTLLTLLIVPVLYTYIYGFTRRIQARRHKHAVSKVEPAMVFTDPRPPRNTESVVMTRVSAPSSDGKLP